MLRGQEKRGIIPKVRNLAGKNNSNKMIGRGSLNDGEKAGNTSL